MSTFDIVIGVIIGLPVGAFVFRRWQVGKWERKMDKLDALYKEACRCRALSRKI